MDAVAQWEADQRRLRDMSATINRLASRVQEIHPLLARIDQLERRLQERDEVISALEDQLVVLTTGRWLV